MKTNFLSFAAPFFSLVTALAADLDPTLVGSWPGFDRSKDTSVDVAVSGNRAYVIGMSGLWILDISDPTHPQLIGGRAYDVGQGGFGTSARRIAVSGTFAYVAGYLPTGLQVIDVTNPAEPRTVGAYVCEASDVAISGNYAFVADGDAGLQVINIGDPAKPQRVGRCDTSGIAPDIVLSGKYAYLADGEPGLQIIDIGEPANPRLVGHYDIAGDAYAVALSDNYASVTHRNPGGPRYGIPGGANYWLTVIDVSNPAQPKRVGSLDTRYYPVEDLALSGNYA